MKKAFIIVALLVSLSLACSFSSIVSEITGGDAPAGEVDVREQEVVEEIVPTDEPIQVDLSSGLAAQFQLNGNGVDVYGDLVSQALNTDAAADRFGDPNGALRFNGVDSFIEVQDNDLLDLTGDFTIAFFIEGNPESDHEWLIMTKHQAGVCQPADTSWMIRFQEEMGLRFVNYDTSVDCGKVILAAPDVNLLDGQWHHVAFVNSETDQEMRLFFDGVLVVRTDNTELNIANNSIPLMIGNQFEGVPQHALDAVLDDLYIFQIALDANQVAALVVRRQ